MGAFVISKRFDDQYKFVFTSRKGKTIFTSTPFELKMDCESVIELVKENVDNCTYLKARAANGKFFFKLMIEELHVATSRKYTTALLLQKGIDEIILYSVQSEILDFSMNADVFSDL
jgi:uncharacterized protein YegP (UPF0339 family)